jgi:Rrf2 family iron-sulfur cluster assembly transcriptional regulator
VIFQHSSELAIRAALFLAQQPPGKLSPIHEIAEDCDVSQSYLAKVIQRLVMAGLLRSFRGAGKGMELARAPEKITLAELVHAMQGTETSRSCVLGLGMCSETHPCALHKQWVPLATGIRNVLDETTLTDLVNSVRNRLNESESDASHLRHGLSSDLAQGNQL